MRNDTRFYRFARFVAQLALGVGVLVAGILILGAVLLVRQVEPEEAWRLAERELKGSVLRYGEQPQRIAHVYRRKATNYFGKANGLLVATPTRLLFVGIEPRDNLADSDTPAPITTAEFPNDTLLELSKQRVYLFLARGVVVQRRTGAGQPAVVGLDTQATPPLTIPRTAQDIRETYAAQGGYEAELDSLADYVNSANARQRREAAAERVLRIKVAEMLNRPLYYEIKRGDALLNIALRFGTTPEQLRAWNNLQGDRVRIRDTMLVKPAGP